MSDADICTTKNLENIVINEEASPKICPMLSLHLYETS